MVPNNGTHRINSFKINLNLDGGPTSLISLSILILMRRLIDIRLILIIFVIHEIVLHLFVELILSSIKVLSLLPMYPLYHLLSKIHEYVGRYVVLDCLNFYFIVSHKMHAE